ncbi:MAG: cell wall-binding repeat-containing protein [Acidimicrobiales bacterium]
MGRRSLLKTSLALVATAALGLAATGAAALAAARPAEATSAPPPPTSLSLAGHGWGHGRGMGQWGALGYALAGQSYSWITSHYYGGTTPGTVPDSDIRVRIVENDGNDIILTSASAFTVAGRTIPAGQAARMHLTATPDTWQVDTAPNCGGPWTNVGQAVDNGAQPDAVAVPAGTSPSAPGSSLLQLCLPGGNMTLRGSIVAAQVSGVARTVDVLPIDSYLQGVVTSESPSYWGSLGSPGPQGEPQGFQALEAQAVAARSYAMADMGSNHGSGEFGYADICDTTACQVYRGVAGETALGILAVNDTAGQVVLTSAGAPALAEFSSSTGGWTAGGQFPAVVDAGDSVCVAYACNPNHDWSASVPVSTIQSSYPSIGTLQSAAVTARSGPAQADFGGRATQVTLTGSTGSVSITGDTFAAQFGLKSDWFNFTGSIPTGTTTSSTSSTTSTSVAPTTTTSTTVASLRIKSERVSGADREGTAIAASQAAFPVAHSAQAVVLTRSDDYADALAGAPLAAREGGPLLLTAPQQLDAAVLAEIRRVARPGAVVYVLGGAAALNPGIDSTLTGSGFKVVRIEGDTRYATAVAIAEQLGNPRTIFEVTGQDFPDGLSAGPAAIAQGAAILLTAGATQSSETSAYLSAHPSDARYAIGGPAARADRGATAIQGPDRYATSVAVAQRFFSRPSVVGVATGANFPDALAAGPALGVTSPLLLVPSGSPLPASVAGYLGSVGPMLNSLEVFGGTTAVTQQTVTALAHSAS